MMSAPRTQRKMKGAERVKGWWSASADALALALEETVDEGDRVDRVVVADVEAIEVDVEKGISLDTSEVMGIQLVVASVEMTIDVLISSGIVAVVAAVGLEVGTVIIWVSVVCAGVGVA